MQIELTPEQAAAVLAVIGPTVSYGPGSDPNAYDYAALDQAETVIDLALMVYEEEHEPA